MSEFTLMGLLVKNKRGDIIFEHGFGKDIISFKKLVQSSFLVGLNQFANDAYNLDMSRIEFDRMWVDFSYLEDYEIYLITHVEPNAGKLNVRLYNYCIQHIKDIICKYFSLPNFRLDWEIYELIVHQLDLNAALLYKRDYETITQLFDIDTIDNTLRSNLLDNKVTISMGIACEPSAIPLFSRSYERNTLSDPILMGSALSAITTFAKFELDQSINVVFIGNYRIFLNWVDDRMYIIILNSGEKDTINFIQVNIRKKINRLLQTMGEALGVFFNEDQLITNDTIDIMNNVMDEYVKETVKSFVI